MLGVLVACSGSPELPAIGVGEANESPQGLHLARKQVLYAWMAVHRGDCVHAEMRMERAMAIREHDLALGTIAREMQMECQANLDALNKKQDEDSL